MQRVEFIREELEEEFLVEGKATPDGFVKFLKDTRDMRKERDWGTKMIVKVPQKAKVEDGKYTGIIDVSVNFEKFADAKANPLEGDAKKFYLSLKKFLRKNKGDLAYAELRPKSKIKLVGINVHGGDKTQSEEYGSFGILISADSKKEYKKKTSFLTKLFKRVDKGKAMIWRK